MTTAVREKNGKYYYTDDRGVEYTFDQAANHWIPITNSKKKKGDKKNSETSAVKPPRPKRHRSVINLIAYWTVKVLTFPFVVIGHILDQFYGDDAPGKQALGAIAFAFGVLLGADNVWQLFGGVSLFPWFETEWLGWDGLAWIWLRPVFYIALSLSILMQLTQGRALRGKSPDKAMADLADNYYELPNQPSGTIDLTVAAWSDLKHAGMRRRRSVGFISIACWAFEAISAFHSHWFLGQPTVALIVGCLVYNVFSIFAGEIGYLMWQANGEETNG